MTDPTDLRDRLAEALRTAPSVLMDTPEERDRHASNPRNHHTDHHYYWGCAVCRGEVGTLATAVLAVVQPELDRRTAEYEQMMAAATVVREQQHREFLEIGTELSQERGRYRSAWLSGRRRARRADRHVEELQDKLLTFGGGGGCCCSYDSPGDVCMVHSPTVRKLEAEAQGAEAELARLRGVLREHAALLPTALAALLAPPSGPREG